MNSVQDRFYNRRWGVFFHYLYPCLIKNEGYENYSWNEMVESFDVESFASELHRAGAGYCFITVMQGAKYMLAPNKTYDKICGTEPGEACATRDLVNDLYVALSKYDIDLYLYYTGDGPCKDSICGPKMRFYNADKWDVITPEFVQNWAAVLEEYSIRYGDKVKGWWIDGCYDYVGYNDELLKPLYEAIKKGNPNAIVAFNNGDLCREEVLTGKAERKLRKCYCSEEFTAGEYIDFTYIPETRFIDGAQAHILAPIGADGVNNEPDNPGMWWYQKGARYDSEYMKEYIQKMHDAGGVVTAELYIYPDGKLDKEQIDMFANIN